MVPSVSFNGHDFDLSKDEKDPPGTCSMMILKNSFSDNDFKY